MSFMDCIEKAVLEKKIRGKDAERAFEQYKTYYDENRSAGMSDGDAQILAARDATLHFEIAKREAVRRRMKSAEAMIRVRAHMDAHPGNPGEALQALVQWDNRSQSGIDYFYTAESIRGLMHSKMNKALEKFAPRKLGIQRPRAGEDDILDEIFGKSSGNAEAREIAAAWNETYKWAAAQYRKAGGSMVEREDWRLPQRQDGKLVRSVDPEDWVTEHKNWLDWDAMRDPHTGKKIPEDKRDAVLREVYDTLATDGASKQPNLHARGKKAVGNRLEAHRFLIYKDVDAWRAMHTKYGRGSVFDSMVAHMDLMARDIAMLETFGPNPHHMVQALAADAQHRAGQQATKLSGRKMNSHMEKTKAAVRTFEDMYAIATHSVDLGEGNAVGHAFASTRNFLTSSLLGSAALPAIPGDLFTTGLTLAANGASPIKFLTRYAKLMRPGSRADQQLAIRSGLIADQITNITYGMSRFTGEVTGTEFSRRMSDAVMRASLLSRHTQMAQWTFMQEMQGALADSVGRRLEDNPLKTFLRNHGITADEWDVIRATPLYEERGAKYLRWSDIEDETLARKLSNAVLAERDFAVPSASIRAQAMMRSQTRAGTAGGELARSALYLKNFPLTILQTHVRRMMDGNVKGGKWGYGAAYMTGMMMTGAMALQMNEVASGRQPRDMFDAKFWGAAMLKGGGLGVFGDLLFTDMTDYGKDFGDTILGAEIGLASDMWKLTMGNAYELATGEDTKFFKELTRFAGSYNPSNLWYSKLIIRRLMWDNLQRLADPAAHQSFARQERKRARDFGQQYWWRPGQGAPSRPPVEF